MKSILYEHQAAAAADTARVLWRRAGDVIDMLEWTLARDPKAGVPAMPGCAARFVVFPGAKSIGMPNVECTFEERAHEIVLLDLYFS